MYEMLVILTIVLLPVTVYLLIKHGNKVDWGH